jgi:Trypsin-like peptidase domain
MIHRETYVSGIVFWLLLASLAYAQNINEDFQRISTPVITISIEKDGAQERKVPSLGTGFFYQALSPKDPAKNDPQWRAIQKVWLVTNRHVLLPKKNGREIDPASVTFHLRRIKGNSLVWEPITLSRDEFIRRARFHQHPNIDVAIVDVLDLIAGRVSTSGQFIPWHGLSKDDFPKPKQIPVEVTDDVVIIGYPRGFYDTVNLYPVVKAGIIASKWGAQFMGEPCFLIEARLFPGSSGSVVVTKPKDQIVFEGKPMYSPHGKQLALLGIYSGNVFHKSPIAAEPLHLGVVWYGEVIEEIIQQGQSYVPRSDDEPKANSQAFACHQTLDVHEEAVE